MSQLTLSPSQLEIVSSLSLNTQVEPLLALLSAAPSDDSKAENIVLALQVANALYRSGSPLINDASYDRLTEHLKQIDPENSFLMAVEPEALAESKTVALPQKMLSTDKAYSFEEIDKWIDRIIKAASELEIKLADIEIRVTPKLDGYAAFDDGTRLYTRGDGVRGQDISRAIERGLQIAKQGERGLGAGEIVISKRYFDEVLSAHFENSRNIQAAIIAEKNVDPNVKKAIDAGACVFYPFSLLENWTGHYSELLSNFEDIVETIWNSVEYDIDGVILETTDARIKAHMGATRKHHRWQIAFKVNEDTAEVEVLSVTPQTSRTGRVTPVAELKPTKLSGALLSRATVHHYNMVKTNGVGPGAIIQLVRSGLVIPKIEKVLKSVEPQLPERCPSCNTPLLWESDHLVCPNKSDCPAQTENTLIHFFKTLGNNDGFGPKVIEKLSQLNVKHIHEIYALKQHQFSAYGFGDKTSQNLFEQLQASREIEIEDWRFLSAFGVSRLAGGNCEKLLQHYSLLELFELDAQTIVSIDGFAQLSAQAIVEGLANIKPEFLKVYELGFTLSSSRISGDGGANESPIVDAVIVFTGTMLQGSRGDMEKQAKALGAKVAKSVTGKTTYLVTGAKVGETKINAALAKGVEVLTEQAYLDLIAN